MMTRIQEATIKLKQIACLQIYKLLWDGNSAYGIQKVNIGQSYIEGIESCTKHPCFEILNKNLTLEDCFLMFQPNLLPGNF